MALLDYTTYEDVRAILGVSTTELTDKRLALALYVDQAEFMLADIYEPLPALFATIKLNPAPTATEAKLEKLVSLYFSYSVAKLLVTSLPMFAVKGQSDGRAQFNRFDEQLDDVRDGVDSGLSAVKARLLATLNLLIPGAVSTTAAEVLHIVATGIVLDPVTGV